MRTHTRKTAISLAITSVLMLACSPTKQISKPSQIIEPNDFLMKTSLQQAKATPAIDDLRSFPTAPAPARAMKVAGQQDCGKHQINNNGAPEDAVKIRVTGYGAPPKSFYPDPQRRLMAMRAAKIDAYRSLAERVTGIQIWGGTTIGDMVVEKDRFRVYIDTYINGARVIAENPLDDGTFETIVELTVDQNFLSNTLPEKIVNDCIQNVNTPTYKGGGLMRTADANDVSNANFYFSR